MARYGRHGVGFSYNFYVSTDAPAYIRIVPRVKRIGGFELATGIFVNTQDPAETVAFLKEHFNKVTLQKGYKAKYKKAV